MAMDPIGYFVQTLPYASKHLVRSYLDPKNIPKTPSQEVWKTRASQKNHHEMKTERDALREPIV